VFFYVFHLLPVGHVKYSLLKIDLSEKKKQKCFSSTRYTVDTLLNSKQKIIIENEKKKNKRKQVLLSQKKKYSKII
jgi:hypothetical protein